MQGPSIHIYVGRYHNSPNAKIGDDDARDGEDNFCVMPKNTSKVRQRKIRGCQLLPNAFKQLDFPSESQDGLPYSRHRWQNLHMQEDMCGIPCCHAVSCI